MTAGPPSREGAAISASVHLRPVPASVSLARRFVRATLSGWDLQDAAEIAALLVSELVTNAVLHARSDIDLVVDTADERIRVEVQDAIPITPALRPHDNEALTGRGLALVDSFSSGWGVEPLPKGKSVWFEVPTPVSA